MESSPPAKRKRTAVEYMDMDWSPSTRRKQPYSPLSSTSAASTSSSNLLSPLPSRSLLSPHSLRKGARSPIPQSPLSRSHSRSRSRSPRPSPLSRRHHVPRSPLPHSPLVSEMDDAMESDTKDFSKSPTKQRKSAETKHSLVAKVKREASLKMHNLKQPLLGWLQKFIGDKRLSGLYYIGKLQFHIDPTQFSAKLPVNVTAFPIVPNDDTFRKIASELSGPILSGYPGIFHEMDVPDDLREHSVAHGIDLNIIVAEQLAEVFGKCWDSLGGFVKFHGVAIISINGSHKYYDLVARYWIKEAKAE